MTARATAIASDTSSEGIAFATSAFAFAIVACVLAGWFPIGVSIVAVFLFAGPHNWIEARYFLTRLPARMGKLRGYFCLAGTGVLGLTVGYATITWLGPRWISTADHLHLVLATWNTMLIGWIATMIRLRSKQPPRRDWSFATPLALAAVAAAWLAPQLTSLSLVYLHPLVGLWILDREIARSRPAWQASYRVLLCLLPVTLIALWWRLAAGPVADIDGPIAERITQHAGAALLPMLPGRPLVATHVFLELIHYGVWLLAIPLASRNVWTWKLNEIPVVRRSTRVRVAVISILAIGGLTVIGLWVGFTLDYALARDLYFTVAMLHVLAEIPFLLRSL